MPFKEATFWYGTILFGTGLYFWTAGGDRMTVGIILTVIGLAMSVYAVVAHYYLTLPKLRLWVVLLLVTWSALGYDYYDRHQQTPIQRDESKLTKVSDRTFANEIVPLDGFAYDHCVFNNVTFYYDANSVLVFRHNQIRGTWGIKTNDPKVGLTIALLKGFGVINIPVVDPNFKEWPGIQPLDKANQP